MKNTTFLAAAMIAAIAFGAITTSCNRDNDGNKRDQPQKLTLTARIDATVSRAAITETAEGILKTTWSETDYIRVCNPAANTSEIFELDELSPDGLTATFTGSISTKGGVLYAVHSTNGSGAPGYVEDIYRLQAPDLGYYYTQAGNGNIGNMNNFAILYGSFTPENTAITFRHTMAFFKFTLSLPAGETIPDGGSAEINLDVPTSRYPFMNLATGMWLTNSDPWSEGILRVTVQNLDSEDTEIVGYMAVFPFDAGGREIALSMEVFDGLGGCTTYTKTLAAKTPRLIEGGKYYTVTEQFVIPPFEEGGGTIAPMTPEEF